MMSLRKMVVAAAALWLVLAGAAFAQLRQPYNVLATPQPTEGGGKIEVVEFFWYGCPHCYHLEPILNAWIKGAPKDVVFKRVPAMQGNWTNLASVYYTLEAMGLLDQLHGKVFDAMHKQNINLGNERLREEWLAKQGVDVARYKSVEKSFAVMSKLSRAQQLTGNYRIDSVPQIVVNGKYVVNGETAGGMIEKMMPAVDQAIAAARKEKTAAATPPAGIAQR